MRSQNPALRPRRVPGGSAVVAFESAPDGRSDIFVMKADGSDPVNLTRSVRDEWGPSWSPDGTAVVFMSTGTNGAEDIYTIRIDGTGLVRLTDDPAVDGWPAWRP